MVAKRITPDWVTRIRRHLTDSEKLAFNQYRLNVAQAHARHRKSQLTADQVTRIWADALDKLAAQSQGTSQLTIYLKRQGEHLEAWVTA